LLGVGGDGIDTQELFGAWRTFFERLAAEGPVVLVFEDLHWADSGMLDFIDYVLEWSRALPIFILTLARPELLERRPNWGAGKRQFTSVYLEPLTEANMLELLGGLVPGLPDSAARAITARADGIPLYAVETVRMLVADGRLVEEGGVYHPSGDLSELAVPESLTALIASRLDALDPEARALAQDASVLGQRFTLEGLAAVTGRDVGTLEPHLSTLLRRELVNLETDPRSPERNQYGFVQSLIREVAYNTLAKRDRKARHLAAARFFESLETEELAGALAGQYLAAHANADGPDETAALSAQARVALKAAGERALGLGAPDQAHDFFRQALGLAQDGTDEADLSLRAGRAASLAGRYQDAEPLLRAALDHYRSSDDVDASDGALSVLAASLNDASRYTDAITVVETVIDETTDFAARPSLMPAGAQLARAWMLQFAMDRAIAVADRVLRAAEHGDRPELVADLLVTKGTALSFARQTREGLALITAGRDLGESLGVHHVTIRALINQGSAQEWFAPRRAYDDSLLGLALVRRVGQLGSLLTLTLNASGLAVRLGEWDWAERELAAVSDLGLEGTDRLLAVVASGTFRALRGAPRQELIDEARSSDISEVGVRSLVDSLQAHDALAEGRLGDAFDLFTAIRHANAGSEDWLWSTHIATWERDRAALSSVRDEFIAAGEHGPIADTLRQLMEAGLAALDGRTDEAVLLYQRSGEAFRELGLRFDVALIGIDMATLLDHSLMEVQQAVQESRVILSELGAIPFLERLSAEMSRSGAASEAATPASDPVPIGESEVAAG
jgi:tetratricopeptide (TPR) repeat protein